METRLMASHRRLLWIVLGILPLSIPLLVGGCPPSGPTLPGTWAGNVDYVVKTLLDDAEIGTSQPTEALTVTFDNTGKPDKTIIPLLQNPLVLAEVSLADLTAVGDTATVMVDEQGTERAVDLTVVSVSSTAGRYELELTVEYQSGLGGAPYIGPHTLVATAQNGNTVLWQTETTLDSDANDDGVLVISTASTSEGTLAKQ